MEFEWDDSKARSNLQRHGVRFEEAKTIFNDPLAITFQDHEHSHQEERYLTIGSSAHGKVLLVAHTDRGGRIRLISGRRVTPKERRSYEEGT